MQILGCSDLLGQKLWEISHLFSQALQWFWCTRQVVVQSLSHVWLFVTPWTAAYQASLSFTISQSLLKLMSIESVMPSNHLFLCHRLLLLPSIFPSIRVFSNNQANIWERLREEDCWRPGAHIWGERSRVGFTATALVQTRGPEWRAQGEREQGWMLFSFPMIVSLTGAQRLRIWFVPP